MNNNNGNNNNNNNKLTLTGIVLLIASDCRRGM